MLLGKVPGGGLAPLVSSSPKSAPYTPVDSRPLAVTQAPVEELPEIVVTAKRIPWFAWVLGGVAGFAVLDSLLGRR